LVRALRKLDYAITRQKGSHVRVTTQRNGEHHETIPAHAPLKVGTLHSILHSVAAHHKITLKGLLRLLEL
jgi:predicted RNA binding protein YcfA (HicA-like mRNA interferase family)